VLVLLLSFWANARWFKIHIFAFPKSRPQSVSSSWFASTPCGPCFLDIVFSFKWYERDVTSMCQNFLTFFKYSFPLSTASIATSNTSNVHLPHCVKLRTLLTFVGFFAYARTVGGMFTLYVDCWSCKLLRLLWSIMDIMVLIPYLLVLTSNKLGGFNLVLQEVYIWTSYINPKTIKNGLNMHNVQEHDFPKTP